MPGDGSADALRWIALSPWWKMKLSTGPRGIASRDPSGWSSPWYLAMIPCHGEGANRHHCWQQWLATIWTILTTICWLLTAINHHFPWWYNCRLTIVKLIHQCLNVLGIHPGDPTATAIPVLRRSAVQLRRRATQGEKPLETSGIDNPCGSLWYH